MSEAYKVMVENFLARRSRKRMATLKQLCIKNITSNYELYLNGPVKDVGPFEYLPRNVMTDIQKSLQDSQNPLQASLLPLFISSNLDSLELYGEENELPTFGCILLQLLQKKSKTVLRRLAIKELTVPSDLLSSTIRVLTNLRVLCLLASNDEDKSITDEVVLAVAVCLPQLTSLQIESKAVTNIGAMSLHNNKNNLKYLSRLSIHYTSITQDGVALIFEQFLLQLTDFQHESFEVSLRRYKHMNPNDKLNLKNVNICRSPRKTLKVVAEICPYLERLHLDNHNENKIKNIDLLLLLSFPPRRLKELWISYYSFDFSSFASALSHHGSSIVKITLCEPGSQAIDVSIISYHCPNLRTLQLTDCAYTHTLLHPIEFKALEKCVISEFHPCDPSFPIYGLKAIFLSKVLKSLTFTCLQNLTDNLLEWAVLEAKKNPEILGRLKYLAFEMIDNFTTEHLIKLVCCAPNLAHLIVSYCSNITEADLAPLYLFVADNELDIFIKH